MNEQERSELERLKQRHARLGQESVRCWAQLKSLETRLAEPKPATPRPRRSAVCAAPGVSREADPTSAHSAPPIIPRPIIAAPVVRNPRTSFTAGRAENVGDTAPRLCSRLARAHPPAPNRR